MAFSHSLVHEMPVLQYVIYDISHLGQSRPWLTNSICPSVALAKPFNYHRHRHTSIQNSVEPSHSANKVLQAAAAAAAATAATAAAATAAAATAAAAAGSSATIYFRSWLHLCSAWPRG